MAKVTQSSEQKAQAPRPVGSGQNPQVPTHEGSQLGSPAKAGVRVGQMPADKEAQS